MTLDYRNAGVDLRVAEEVAARISNRLGARLFGGFLPVPALRGYDSPILVSSIDGVGTKVRLAALLDRIEGLGEDIVHHCVNDIAVHGARPLLFLDYLAFHRVDPEFVDRLINSIAGACDTLDILLAGGETAEMPLVYTEGQFDLAGAIVGVVEEREIVDGRTIGAGDVLLGFPSSGLHTNGFSLVQRLFTEADYERFEPALGRTLGEALLEPHRCYLPEIRALIEGAMVHGLAHITGGGIAGNLSRILPAGLDALVELPPAPPLFRFIKERGVDGDEMRAVFNMGIGFIAVCAPAILRDVPAGAIYLGEVRRGPEEKGRVIFA
jgi:phosphoribosylformylglycinamidine cyclo-ligase